MRITEITTSATASALLKASQDRMLENQMFVHTVQSSVGPKILPGNGLTGSVQVTFSLSSDGGLAGAHVSQSSGHAILDQRALEAVSGAAFPMPPSGMGKSRLNFTSQFTFT